MIKVGIIGSTGYAGQNLVYLLSQHSKVDIDFMSSHNHANIPFSDVYPSYEGFIKEKCIDINSAIKRFSKIDVLFIALPHGKSFSIVSKAMEAGVKVVDLGADFRIDDPEKYKEWYGLEHLALNHLNSSVYGLPELNPTEISKADLVANPGCYPTATILALSPLLKDAIIDYSSIVVDAKSGVSGAGRSANIPTLFCESNESIKAYGVGTHRHTPEIEQELSKVSGRDLVISFTPHLVPMNRGILATCYGNLAKEIEEKDLYEIYKDFYNKSPFVRIMKSIPETRWVKGTNLCDIGLRVDKRTNRIIVVSAIDNLIKGAAGQAVQNMNIMMELDETEGLNLMAMMP